MSTARRRLSTVGGRAARKERGRLSIGRPRAALAGVLAAALVLGACTSSRNGLGTPDAACYRVLPEAIAAVHGRGTFAGVRYVAPKTLATERHVGAVPPALVAASRVATCLVAFVGQFEPAAVSLGWSPSGGAGRYAIVVVRQSDSRIVATVVLRHLPLRVARVFPSLR